MPDEVHRALRLRAAARALGVALSPADGLIAATAATHRFAVATRDAGPFQAVGLTVINPWDAEAQGPGADPRRP